jgi:deoxyribodipyrimidine photolyase
MPRRCAATSGSLERADNLELRRPLDWHQGAAWFWDTLVDADLADNSASWQWISGSGADAAPYFRIFNPVMELYQS